MSVSHPPVAPAGAAPPTEGSTAPPGLRQRVRRRVAGTRSLVLVVLLVLVAIFAAAAPHEFATSYNLRSVAIEASSYLILAVGMTFVITTAGIDLSVGSVLVFSGVIGVKVMTALGSGGWPVIGVGLLACLLTGAAWGLINGVLVARAGLPSLIVTLGSFSAAYGGALVVTGGLDLRGVPPKLTSQLGFGRLFGVFPYPVLIAIALTLAGAYTLARTRFGLYTSAIGSNSEAARRAGIRVDRHLIRVYMLSGTLAGLAGFVSLARFSTTSIAGHQTDNLQAIVATVLGGTSLFGGVGTVIGTAFGSLIPAVLNNGFVIIGLQPFWQQVAVGTVLVSVVYIDQRARRRRTQR